MAATSFLNAGDLPPERVISADDRTHRVLVSSIYELPFGRGRRLLPDPNPVLGAIVNGWQVGGIHQFQTGEPYRLGDFIFYGDSSTIALSRSETNSSKQRSSAIRYQSSRFGGLRAAPIDLMGLSAIKKTKLTERFSFELRAEAIDALNHAIFDIPNTSVTAGTSGTVTATKSASRKVQFALYLRF
jgi:hypothetical protein